MTKFALSAKVRKVFGRKVKSLRREGRVPGNVFGKGKKSVSVELELKALVKVMREAGETNLIDLSIAGEKTPRPVLVAGYAKNPVTEELLHVDLHEVDLTVKTTASVPVKVVGESPAVAAGKILVLQRNEIEVEALPADLPQAIEVDIVGLTEVGMSVLAKDLAVDRNKVKLDIGDDEVIVTVQEPAKEEVVAPPAPVEGEEGVTPAEGEKVEEGETKTDEKKEEPKAEK